MSDRLSVVSQFDDAVEQEEASWLDEPTCDIPIDVNFLKRQFSALHLREPKAKEIEKAERELNVASPTAYHFRKYQMALVAAVANVPIEVVGELTNSQLRKAWDFLAAKLGPGSPETGATSSQT